MASKFAKLPNATLAGVCLVALAMTAAQAASPASPAASATTAAAPKPPEPPAIPPSVPDEVNPFAKDDSQPEPLKWPSASRPGITVDVHPTQFDGLTIMEMIWKGPDFEWQFDPLSDFVPAPAGSSESLAFAYETKPEVRLSIALYRRGELLPQFNADAMVAYLAAIRAKSPKNFVLLTPIPHEAQFIQPDGLCGFQAQAVDYAIVTQSEVIIHHDLFLDLHNQYVLLAGLSGPQAMVDRLKPTIRLLFARSRLLNGLGVKEEAPRPAATGSSNT